MDDKVKVETTPPFKLKSRLNRSWQAINLKKQFGFIPETIIVEKYPQGNNILVVHAVLTPEELAKRKKESENIKKIAIKPKTEVLAS